MSALEGRAGMQMASANVSQRGSLSRGHEFWLKATEQFMVGSAVILDARTISMTNDMLRRTTAEFFGTFWLTFGGCGAAVLAAAFPVLGIGFAV